MKKRHERLASKWKSTGTPEEIRHQKITRGLYCFFIMGIALWGIQFWIDFFSTNPPHVLNNSVFHQDYNDSFADFFNINCYIQGFSPYLDGNNSSYPPFNFIIAMPFTLLMKLGRFSAFLPNVSVTRSIAWQDWLSLAVLFAVYLAMIVTLCLLFQKKRSPSPHTLGTIIVICLLSAPLLFLMERANYLFFTFFFVCIFLLCHTSEKRWERWLSYICLAFAVAMKMYPAVFALLLLKKKRYKDVFITALLSIVFFFLPFFCLKGGFLANLQGFLTHLRAFNAYERLSIDVSTGNLFRIFAYIFGANYLSDTLSYVALTVRLLLFCLSVPACLFAKRSWQSLTLLGLLAIIVPMPAMIHSLIFVLPGFVAWLTQQRRRIIDYWYATLFFFILTPLQFGHIIEAVPRSRQMIGIAFLNPHYIGLSVNTLLEGLCVMLLAITICVDICVQRVHTPRTVFD